MTKSECVESTKLIYQEFYRQVTLNSDYVLPENSMNDGVLNNFCDYIDRNFGLKRVGADWIIEFMELSFHWWYKSKHLKYGLQSIKLSWVVGKSAIDRFNKIKNDHNKLTFFKRNIRTEVGLSVRNKIHLKNSKFVEANRDWLIDALTEEEQFKSVFYNKPEGLIWCISNTTLFNHKSKLCVECKNRLKCKDTLKANMPKLFKLRGY